MIILPQYARYYQINIVIIVNIVYRNIPIVHTADQLLQKTK